MLSVFTLRSTVTSPPAAKKFPDSNVCLFKRLPSYQGATATVESVPAAAVSRNILSLTCISFPSAHASSDTGSPLTVLSTSLIQWRPLGIVGRQTIPMSESRAGELLYELRLVTSWLIKDRKTGVTLKDPGIRDEQGLAPIEGIFSSPEKPTTSSQRPSSSSNGKTAGNRTLTEEDMDLTTSISTSPLQLNPSLIQTSDSLPEPTTVLGMRRSLPPRSRSPIKTSIGSPRKSVGGSPRKSMGLLSSPAKRFPNGTPSYIGSQDEPSAIVDIAAESLARSIEGGSQQSNEKRMERSPLAAKVDKVKKRKQPFDISSDEYDEPEVVQEEHGEPEPEVPPVVDEEPPVNGDNSMDIPSDIEDEGPQLGLGVASAAQKPTGKGRKPKKGTLLATKDSIASKPKDSAEPGDSPQNPSESEAETSLDPGQSIKDVPKKRRGRPPKAKQREGATETEVYRDPDDAVEDGPSKPAKRAKIEIAGSSASKVSKKRPPPSARDPNAQITSRPANKGKSTARNKELSPANLSTADSDTPSVPTGKNRGRPKAQGKQNTTVMPPPPKPARATSTDTVNARGKPRARSLQILRSTTPADEDGARFTRSGRATVKPIEYWRGERIVYAKPKKIDSGRISLGSIQEVVRAEDLPEEKRPRAPRSQKRRRRQAMLEEEEDESDSGMEEWEEEPGVLGGEVWQWDPRMERGDAEVMEEIGMSISSLSYFYSKTCLNVLLDLAIAPKGLQSLTKEVKNQTFEYAKTITLPFFHSGMVDIPPAGEKRTKNSRKNHMVFWVFAGRVVVDVSGNEFSVGKGGMWQVPRGESDCYWECCECSPIANVALCS